VSRLPATFAGLVNVGETHLFAVDRARVCTFDAATGWRRAEETADRPRPTRAAETGESVS
jgi:hypothetical protein